MIETTTTTIEQAAPGPDTGNLEQLWREFSRELRTFILRRVSSADDADDILQIVFLRMAKGLDELRDKDRILGWMFAITRNAITDYYRSAPHRRELSVDAVPDNPTDTDSDPVDDVARELSACLAPMLAGLPTDQADAVRMVDLQAQTHTTAATTAGISLSGMKSRVQRGRAALRRRLQDCCRISQDRRGHVHDYQPRDRACDCATTSNRTD